MTGEDSFTDDERPLLLLHPHVKTVVRPLLLAVAVQATLFRLVEEEQRRLERQQRNLP